MMAENESLNLGKRNARRWDAVYDAVRKEQPSEKVAAQISTRLCQALRRALKQLAEKGASLETLLAHRDSPAVLRQLLKQAGGHEYVEVFANTALTERDSGTQELLTAFIDGIWEAVSDQIREAVVGTGRWTNFVDLEIFLNEVQCQIEPDVQHIAQQLAADPSWMPKRKASKSGDKADSTAEMLGMSLLGIQHK